LHGTESSKISLRVKGRIYKWCQVKGTSIWPL
jgi:hypothetical protein